jgi:hypothetical protein
LGYRLATALLVKLPTLFGLKSVYPTRDQLLARYVDWIGDYLRPIRTQADVSALMEKQKVDPDYNPRNVPLAPTSASSPAQSKEREDVDG